MPVNLVKELPREKGCQSPRNNPARPKGQSISETDIEKEFPQLSSSKSPYYIETNDELLNKDDKGEIWRETIIPSIYTKLIYNVALWSFFTIPVLFDFRVESHGFANRSARVGNISLSYPKGA